MISPNSDSSSPTVPETMAVTECADLLRHSVYAWNDRRKNDDPARKKVPKDLRGIDLRGANLDGADLRDLDLSDADFSNAVLSNARLDNAILESANLTELRLNGTDMSNVRLGHTNLAKADLRNAHHVKELKFPRCNLKEAKFSEDDVFFDLSQIEETSKNGRSIYFFVATTILICLGNSFFTDFQLLTNTGTVNFPIITAKDVVISPFHFFWLSPLLIVCLFVYFHIYLLNHWAEIAKQPVIFPCGRTIDQRCYPWFLNFLASVHFFHEDKSSWPAARILQRGKALLAFMLCWWIAPITIIFLFARILPLHSLGFSVYYFLLLSLTLLFVWISFRATRRTLNYSICNKNPSWDCIQLFFGIASISTIIAFCVFTFLVLLYAKPDWRWLHLDVSNKEISAKLTDWHRDNREDPNLVAAIDLENRNLKKMIAENSFLFKANLNGASLSGSILEGSDLRYAELKKSDLRYANLRNANLEVANLDGANLQRAALLKVKFPKNLHGVNLSRTDLKDIYLEGVNLKEAKLANATLTGVNGIGADLSTADLSEAIIEGASSEFGGAVFWKAKLDRAVMNGGDFHKANFTQSSMVGAQLKNANLSNAILDQADLKMAYLYRTDLKDASLKGTHLEGADLRESNVSFEQLRSAIIDDSTQLPRSIEPRRQELKSPTR